MSKQWVVEPFVSGKAAGVANQPVVVGDNVHFLGQYGPYQQHYRYNFKTKTFDTVILPSPRKMNSAAHQRIYGGTVFYKGKIYLFYNLVEIFDLETQTWTYGTSMESALGKYCEGVNANLVDGKVYIMGGAPYSATLSKECFVYDIETDSWAQIASKQVAVWIGSATTVAVGKKIYAFECRQTVDGKIPLTLEIYDTETNSWSLSEQQVFTRNRYIAAVVAGTDIYIINCYDDEERLYVYDTVSGTYRVDITMRV